VFAGGEAIAVHLPRVRLATMVLVALGLAMLALGIWVEDRPAVAAPLVVLGALIVVAAVIFEGWADSIEELSVGQSGLTMKRQIPTTEDLTQAGLPEEAAREIQEWMETLWAVLPRAIDERVKDAMLRQARDEGNYRAALRKVAEHEARQRHGEEQDPD
jgi:hypothetical protein